jgi:hypothetical protein
VLRATIGAVITWGLPLLLSFGLYNPETKIYVPSYIGFKFIMALASAAITYVTMRWVSNKQTLRYSTLVIYVGLNSALDLLLLVGLFEMPIFFWATTVLPIYVGVFGVVYIFVLRNQTIN